MTRGRKNPAGWSILVLLACGGCESSTVGFDEGDQGRDASVSQPMDAGAPAPDIGGPMDAGLPVPQPMDAGAPAPDISGPMDAGLLAELPPGGPLKLFDKSSFGGFTGINCEEDPTSRRGQFTVTIQVQFSPEVASVVPSDLVLVESFDVLRGSDLSFLIGPEPIDTSTIVTSDITGALEERGTFGFVIRRPGGDIEPVRVETIREFCRSPAPNSNFVLRDIVLRFTFESSEGTFHEYLPRKLECGNCEG